MAFLGDLARKRSLASAAFLFLLLVDEIEGLAYMAVAVVLGQPDLFLSMQQVFFPVVLLVAGVVSLTRNWRRPVTVEPLAPIEAVELNTLTQRIGAPARARIASAMASASSRDVSGSSMENSSPPNRDASPFSPASSCSSSATAWISMSPARCP